MPVNDLKFLVLMVLLSSMLMGYSLFFSIWVILALSFIYYFT